MKFRKTLTGTVGLAAILGGVTIPTASATELAGATVWSRSSEGGPLAEIGSKYTGPLEGLSKNSSHPDSPRRPAPSSPEQEAQKAKESGDTYLVNPSAKPTAGMSANAADPSPDFATCNSIPEGHRPQGAIINHFEFCRWGYNTATKLDGQGRVEGQVRFKETEVGKGNKAGRLANMHVKITELKASGIFATGANMSLRPMTAGYPDPTGCEVKNFGPNPHMEPVANWNNAYMFYQLSSPNGDPGRIDKVSTCVYDNNYKVSSSRGETDWSDGNDGGLRMDSAAYLNPYGTEGAIFDRVTPFLTYDYNDTNVRAVAGHIAAAFANPNATFPRPAAGRPKLIPGNYFGNGTKVTRNYPGFNAASEQVQKDNRRGKDQACAALTKPDPTYQCDEFPFASTKEGAGKGDGNFSVRYVPQPDNSKAGAALSKWYGEDRILDGDAYGVRILNAPANP
ncbi:NucA/NucB deoxyribonuclease domain-containing protein [Streptomyces racemochromogenes]|uniref:NucA/NucB deoxyribonuclease domain-containing protein n=1 Tax=Streptomyces racemochromogenes TaxID=67353 RepID=UPI0035E4C608